jgi:hypothetical protein
MIADYDIHNIEIETINLLSKYISFGVTSLANRKLIAFRVFETPHRRRRLKLG